jgi:hypothetical protein
MNYLANGGYQRLHKEKTNEPKVRGHGVFCYAKFYLKSEYYGEKTS